MGAQAYKLKDGVIHAMQLTPENNEEVAVWCNGVAVDEFNPMDEKRIYKAVNVPTYTGNQRAHESDFIIRGPHGDFAIMNESTFHATYQDA